MKKILIFLIVFCSLSVQASDRDGLCNFLIELGDDIEMGATYTLENVGFKNIKLKHQKKIMAKFNFPALINTTVNMLYLQNGLANICRYKKWEIEKVRIEKAEKGILLELHYALIPKNTKSKNQAIWAKG